MRDEILIRAGLTVIRDGSPLPAVSPLDAWSKIIGVAVVPEFVVRNEGPDHLVNIDQCWHQISKREGVLGDDCSFWIHVAGAGALQQEWRKVRISGKLEVARSLGPKPGEPEFLTLSANGQVLCGVTTEEDGIWIVTARL